MRIFLGLIFPWAIAIVAGCQTNSTRSESAVQPTPTVTQDVHSVVVTIDPSLALGPSPTVFPGAAPALDAVPGEILALVMNDLTERTGAEPGNIHVLETEAVEWPDSSLGCGQPGEIYLPVITPGFRIMLEVDGQVYSYHTNMTNQFILCEIPDPIMINPDPSR